jgi:hypothetical protein
LSIEAARGLERLASGQGSSVEAFKSRFYGQPVLRVPSVIVPSMTQSKARGINVHGWIDFSAQDASGVWHGFLYKGGTFTQFDVPNATNTFSFGRRLQSRGKTDQ